MIMQVSASFVESADRVRGLEIGADAYLTEPLEADELVANVRALLRLKDVESQKDVLVRQKELLFKELNHRVKNNLQLISSLLNVQSRRITDPKAREEFKTAQQRVRTIASLHARLYRDDNGIGSVNVQHYLRELSEQLKTLLLAERPNVVLAVKGDDFEIDIDRATSLGLIINELVSNAVKHAFVEGRPGSIFVELTRRNSACELCVADDGRGQTKANGEQSGLGRKLVELFAAQMDGSVSHESTPGLRVTVMFPVGEVASDQDVVRSSAVAE
jgi:two-component sensor histidine kinase